MSEYQGRRLPDTRMGDLPDDLQPGDYWRYVNEDGEPVSAAGIGGKGNLTDGVWGVSAPNGAGLGTLVHHTVREHPDGTCSIRHNDGSSNSVLITGGPVDFHGFMEHGVWRDT